MVDPDGHLLGIVSRRDLLCVFLRPDEEIVAEARAAAIDGVVATHNELIVNPRSGRVTSAARPSALQRGTLVPRKAAAA